MAEATALELAIKDEELGRYIEANLERILELFSPRHIIAFGSRVSGKPREDSDIDLIVVSDLFEGIKFLERSRLFNEAIPWHLRVDVWCLTVEEFERMRRQIGVVADACREGVWVLKGVLLPDDEVKEVMTPEEQAKQWLAQGDEDLRKALILYDNDAFDGAVTFAQQAAEKYLKALYLVRFQMTPPRTHDLEQLAISLRAPSEIVAIGKPLTEDFPKSRYLDATGGVPPYLYFDATIAKERIEQAKQIRDWVKQQLNLP
ncbi:MAG: HEPN domain-containing protein [Armatimonadetes bacterium]|nr:HEPN domain-containing protein [Armatimonadota bacterium]